MPNSEMPRYKCHKEAHALKISSLFDDGGTTRLLVEAPFSPIEVSAAWVAKHDPKAGGYYVVYKDGYASFSPAEAFDDGYTRTDVPSSDLENRFTYHPPKGNQAERYVWIRDHAKSLAAMIDELCPDSREKSLAVTNLEESVMWANASIARNE